MAQDEAKDNVVNLADRRSEGENNHTTPEEFINSFPKEVQDELERYDVWVGEFVSNIDKALLEKSEESNELRDISLPLEALIRTFSDTAASLDFNLEPSALEIHTKKRIDLANHLGQEIQKYIEKEGNTTPIYQQDIFLALSYVMTSYIYQQRVYVISKTLGVDEDGGTADADTNQTE